MTGPRPSETSGVREQVFERAVFRWPAGSEHPQQVTRVPLGLEALNSSSGDLPEPCERAYANHPLATSESTGNAVRSSGLEKARTAFLCYFFGIPLRAPEPLRDGSSIMYFSRAAFIFPTGGSDPTEVRQVPLGSEVFASLNAPPPLSPWTDPIKVVLLTTSVMLAIVSFGSKVLMQRSPREEREQRPVYLRGT